MIVWLFIKKQIETVDIDTYTCGKYIAVKKRSASSNLEYSSYRSVGVKKLFQYIELISRLEEKILQKKTRRIDKVISNENQFKIESFVIFHVDVNLLIPTLISLTFEVI